MKQPVYHKFKHNKSLLTFTLLWTFASTMFTKWWIMKELAKFLEKTVMVKAIPLSNFCPGPNHTHLEK